MTTNIVTVFKNQYLKTIHSVHCILHMLYPRSLFQSDLVRYFNVYIVIPAPVVMMIFILQYAYLVHFPGGEKGHKPFDTAVVY